MKKTFSFLVAILGCTLFTISVTAVSAQSTVSASTMDMVPAADLPHADVWKTTVDYAAVIATERANTAVVLATTPNLKETGLALYTGYDRMLGYMQADLIANVPLEDIAGKNFKRVLLESTADPILQNIQFDEFTALYNDLVAKLVQP